MHKTAIVIINNVIISKKPYLRVGLSFSFAPDIDVGSKTLCPYQFFEIQLLLHI